VTPERYLDKLRALCQRLPDTAEKQSWGHPNFTAGGRIFAAAEVYRGRPSFGIATSLEEQSFLVQDERFAIAPYVGKHGWVTVWLDTKPEWALLEDLLRKAHARVLAKAGGTRKPAKKKVKARPRSRQK
jgi:predicted DNA-binding protein (MmcQ/YjbR family)